MLIDTSPKRRVGSSGPHDAKIVFVGEAPGDQEVRSGEPFVGPAGSLLTEQMRRAGILRADCYFTNVVKEQPHRNNIRLFLDLDRRVPVITPAYEAYVRELKTELEQLNPNIIVAVGGTALFALTGKRGILKQRGSIFESTLLPGKKVAAIIHPASALRQYIQTHLIQIDLRKVLRHSTTPDLLEDTREYVLRPSFDQVMAYLDDIERARQTAFDIEVSNGEVSCISFSEKPGRAISIPFVEGTQDYFPIPQEAIIWRRVARILEDPDIEKIAHNGSFDASFLLAKYGIRCRNLHDTMIMQAILFPDFVKNVALKGKSLGFVTSLYSDLPYYKDEGKEAIFAPTPSGSAMQFWLYNAKDSIVLMEAAPKMLADLDKQKNREAYENQRKLIEPLLYMSSRGIRIDAPGLVRESALAEARMKDINEAISAAMGRDVNLNSPKQVKELFYDELKAPVYMTQGKPSTDNLAMARLARNKNQKVALLARLVTEYRKVSKLNGTYYKIQLDDDSRLRCSMNPVGTRMGRLSSSKTIFGKGANMQNQPKEMKKYMLPDPGCIVVNVDLSQSENRITAYLAGEERMIQAFEQGVDIHRLTAAGIFNKTPEEISTVKGSTTLGGGHLSERDIGKRANHGLNYGLHFKKASLMWEMPEAEGKFIVERYHALYPRIRQWHAATENTLRKTRTLVNVYGRHYTFIDRWEPALLLEAYAYVPQSTNADHLNRYGVLPLYYDQQRFGEAEFLLQVHDSVVFQIPVSVGWKRIAEIMLAMKSNLELPMKIKERACKIPCDFTIHTRNLLGEMICEPGEEGVPRRWFDLPLEQFATFLQEAYEADCANA